MQLNSSMSILKGLFIVASIVYNLTDQTTDL